MSRGGCAVWLGSPSQNHRFVRNFLTKLYSLILSLSSGKLNHCRRAHKEIIGAERKIQGVIQPTRLERLLGAVSDCSEARRSFSKLAVPASCLASATADSAVRASYPRFTRAETTSASAPAGDAAAGLAASIATASSLSFSSTTMRSAVLRPTPGIRVSRAKSPPRIAGTNSSTLIPDKILSASEGPTPEAESSSSKKCFSREETNP